MVLHLEDGRIVVVEGVASHKDGETRLSVTNLNRLKVQFQLTEEVTWLLIPMIQG
jgi:hypothetical protein